MQVKITRSATVITPTMGSNYVQDAVRSVADQTYPVKHLLVADGPDAYKKLTTKFFPENWDNVTVTSTPINTGANNFYGHRIYAAYPHLVDSDFILFLDEDNWFEPEHVANLIGALEANPGCHFSHSFRKIHSKTGAYLLEDNCESLGSWPIYFTHEDPQYLIDTSSYCFRREWLVQVCNHWHSGWGGDRRFLHIVRHHFGARFVTVPRHTLCYRLDGNPNSVTEDFFINGNQTQFEHYKGRYPWTS